MFTKLYGGQGPEYLKRSRSSYFRLMSFTFSSNAVSCERSTRKAALRIIRSPIGLFERLATATGFSASGVLAAVGGGVSSSAPSMRRPSCIRAKYVELAV